MTRVEEMPERWTISTGGRVGDFPPFTSRAQAAMVAAEWRALWPTRRYVVVRDSMAEAAELAARAAGPVVKPRRRMPRKAVMRPGGLVRALERVEAAIWAAVRAERKEASIRASGAAGARMKAAAVWNDSARDVLQERLRALRALLVLAEGLPPVNTDNEGSA